ncbi:hypothetical protein L798_08323 [Zootermopsis nevadensis]|uniref:Uncharacterized protein n=2 Tax=Zootermopsis nevadensis TaxID=136037 RepID=A0A067R383_ZOONE|nr:hypothetical protein L798_08323 [Zootermopsis nevadensis]
MKFLEGSISLRSSVGNDLPPPLQKPKEEENSQMDDSPSTEDTSHNDTAPSASHFPTTPASIKPNKRKICTEKNQLIARAMEIFDSPRDLQKFGDFVVAELCALRNPLLMRRAKRSIMRILLDTSAADDGLSAP